MYRLYRYFNSLSLDVAAGAVVSSAFFAHVAGQRLSISILICLGLSVWLIYTADHLLDAYRLKTEAVTARHLLHQKHFKIIGIAFMALFLVNLWIVFFLPGRIVFYGASLGVVVVFYFLVQMRLLFLKEVFGAALYTAGVILPVAAAPGFINSIQFWVLTVLFFLIAMLNLMLFSWYDAERDRIHKHPSFVTALGKANARRVMFVLFATGICSVAMCWWIEWIATLQALIYGAMMLTLWLLLVARKHFELSDKHRLLGDVVFFYPLWMILL
ncbi:MAG: hypothetical protein AB7K37_00865 [Cyclobacteriaceae bacterium]